MVKREWLRRLVHQVRGGRPEANEDAVGQSARLDEIIARLTRIEEAIARAPVPLPVVAEGGDPSFALPNGTAYRLSLGSGASDAYREGVAGHGAQFPEWRFCFAWLRPGDVFFDVGANIGVFSVPAGVLGAEVHAFELLAENVARIVEGARLNGLDRLAVTLGAVWDVPGVLGFAGASAWGTVSPGAQTLIAASTLDGYAGQRGVGRVDFVKLDVEGAEKAALAGARALIERDHPEVLFESNTLTCGGFGYSHRQLLGWLRGRGYRLYRVGDGVLHPWSEADVQEVVVADYLATTRPEAEIAARSGWRVQPMSEAEQIESVLGEDRFGDFHRLHVLAVRDQLPPAVRDDGRVGTLLESWGRLSGDPALPVLRVGVAPDDGPDG